MGRAHGNGPYPDEPGFGADLDLDLDGDTLREECGVFGIFGHPDAAAVTALGLHALQHRGQEAAGIVSFDGKRFSSERRMGLVSEHFSTRSVIDRLPGSAAIGHVRYSTTGETILRNVQPLFAELDSGGFAVAHNGNLTNALSLRRELIRDGAIYQSTSDTEVILHIVARSRRPRILERFIEALRQIEGAYSLVAIRWAFVPWCWANSTAITFWRPRPARSTSSAHALCATSRTAKSS
jgi:amidophosphoribosyltransferase